MSLRALARQHGIATRYGDRPVPDATLRLLLSRLGAQGEGAACHMPGWLVQAPAWGVFCQLYELRAGEGRPDWGIGDLHDLAHLAGALGAAGADFLGVNPLHALFLGDPDRRSPFFPSDRRFLNPIYVAPDALPGGAHAEAGPGTPGDLVDYPAVVARKLAALRAVHAAHPFGEGDWGREAHDVYLEEGGEALRRHALFEALSLHMTQAGHGAGWRGWPEPFRDVGSGEVEAFARERGDEVAFHLWLQWVTSVQLGLAAQAAREAGMRIGLYLDLAVGEAPDGAAAWGSDVVMDGLSVGAPPDVFAADGQDWGLAAPNPTSLARDPAPFRDMIAAQMRHAGALRIDHAMALRQLFLIPEGEGPAAGAHVRYPMDTLLGVLAEESHRHGALVIGEDLGFVPDGFQDAMADVNVLSYRILYFEQDDGAFRVPEGWPDKALACLSTHDLPTLAGWWRGEDIALRREHGLVSAEDTPDHEAQRARERRALLKLLRSEGLGRRGWKASGPLPDGMLVAAYRLLARTPCALVGVRLSDLVGPALPTNLPGTLDSHPNWRPRCPLPVDRIAREPALRAVSEAMAQARPR